MRIKACLLLIVVAMIWGSGFIFSQIALDTGATPLTILSIRFPIAFIIVGIVFIKHLKNFTKQELIGGVITGGCLFFAFAFQTLGLQYTTPSSNAFLTAINVLIVPLICWGVYRQPPRKNLWIGSLAALLGIGLLTIKSDFKIGMGDSLSLLCSIGFALHIFFTGHYRDRISIPKIMVLQMATASILSLICSLLLEGNALFIADYSMKSLIAIVYLGVMSTCVAFFMQTYAQQYAASVETSIILSSEAFFATVFSIMLGYEKLTLNIVFGGTLIIIAAIIAEVGDAILEKIKCLKST
ncbi:DMT family transporter [Niameybacter massiliensis]|uniref:DMT family transporter n=1 Tax=Niameybacter massiliensis TaxID=1658108 RepID=UPI0006B664E7|nr:DMT family transporter [Niameybacter massiliensis]